MNKRLKFFYRFLMAAGIFAVGVLAPVFVFAAPVSNTELLNLNSQYKTAISLSQKSLLLDQLVQKAKERKEEMARLIFEDPSRFLAQSMDLATRASLPTEIQQFIEEKQVVEGILNVAHIDKNLGQSGATFEYRYYLSTKKNNYLLHFADRQEPALKISARVRVLGAGLEDNFVTSSPNSSSFTTIEPFFKKSPDNMRVAIIVYNVANKENPSEVYINPASPQGVYDVLFVQGRTVDAYYREASYGKSRVSAQAFGPYSVEFTPYYDDYKLCSPSNVLDGWYEAVLAADKEIDLTRYTQILLISPCPSGGGWGTVGSWTFYLDGKEITAGVSWMFGSSGFDEWNVAFNQYVAEHELGHNRGLLHANFYDCGTLSDARRCNSLPYGDGNDIMGYGRGHFNAAHKHFLGWFSGQQVERLTKPTSASDEQKTVFLSAVEDSSEQTKSIIISIGKGGIENYFEGWWGDYFREQGLSSEDYYYIEYRTKPSGSFRAGVYIYKVFKLTAPTAGWFPYWGIWGGDTQMIDTTPTSETWSDALDAPLAAGEKFINEDIGLAVEYVRNLKNRAEVVVSFGKSAIVSEQAAASQQSSAASAQSFTYNLYRGLRDSGTNGEVTALQRFLAGQPGVYPEGLVTGFFGPLTEQAVQRFQKQRGLVSSGAPDTTGYGVVGPRTRALIRESSRTSTQGGVAQQSTIRVLSPNGGEQIQKGQTHTIRWSAPSSTNLVYVELYKDLPFLPSNLIGHIARAESNTGSYVWDTNRQLQVYNNYGLLAGYTSVPEGNNFYVVVGDTQSTALGDASDAAFSIVAPPTQQPTISSISPAQGTANTSVTIYGTNLSGASNVKFYTSSGQMIGSLIPSSVSSTNVIFTISGTFAANVSPGTYQVGVVTNACAGGCNSNRVSFTLTAPPAQLPDYAITRFEVGRQSPMVGDLIPLKFVFKNIGGPGPTPNTTFVHEGGFSQSTTFSCSGVQILNTGQECEFNFTLSYSTAGTKIIGARVDASNLIQEVDDVYNNVKVIELTVSAVSPATIQVLSPNGGEQIQKGQIHTIRWSAPASTPTVAIHLYSSAIPSYIYYIGTITKSVANTGSFSWSTGQNISVYDTFNRFSRNTAVPTGTDLYLLIEDPASFGSATGYLTDMSDAAFQVTVLPPPPPPAGPVTLSANPTSGTAPLNTTLTADALDFANLLLASIPSYSAWAMQWSFDCNGDGRIDKSYRNQSKLQTNVCSYSSAGTYTASVNVIFDSENKVERASASTQVVVSAITPIPSITVLSPNGGEVWRPQFQGGYSSHTVKWSYTSGTHVDGYLYRTSGGPVSEFCEIDRCGDLFRVDFSGVSASAGQAAIRLPEAFYPAHDYRVHLSLGGPGDREVARDDSDASFSIVAPTTAVQPTISSISPNQGTANTVVTIYGTNLSGASNVEFYTSSGQLAGSLIPSSVSATNVIFTISGLFAANVSPGTYQVGVVTNACPGGCNSNRVGFTLTAPIVPINQPPVIDSVFGPTVLQAGQQGWWIVNAHDPESDSMAYSVAWGDGSPASIISLSRMTSVVFNHTYTNAGIYNAEFVVSDTSGNRVSKFVSVQVQQQAIPSISYLTATPGTVNSNDTITFSWSSQNAEAVEFSIPCYSGLSIMDALNSQPFACGVGRRVGTSGSLQLRFTNTSNSPISAVARAIPVVGGVVKSEYARDVGFIVQSGTPTQLPDYVIKDLTVQQLPGLIQVFYVGDSIPLKFIFKNIGGPGPLPATEFVHEGADIVSASNSTCYGMRTMNTGQECALDLVLKYQLAGTKTISARVDTTNAAQEIDENNNTRIITFTVNSIVSAAPTTSSVASMLEAVRSMLQQIEAVLHGL